ncbi:MAG: RtcB family protein, partial [Candidatus Micrarchaeota archaeon]
MEFKKIRDAVWQADAEGTMKVPARLYAVDELVPQVKTDRTMNQVRNVASLPGIVDAALLMPDAHEGYGFPIGGVAAFDLETGVVSPGGVGYDINCGVRLLRTSLDEKEVKPLLQSIIDASFKNIPSGVGSKGRLRLQGKELEDAVTLGSSYVIEKGYGVKKDAECAEEGGGMKGADFSKVSDMAKKRGAPQFGTLGSGNHFFEVQKVEKIFAHEVAKAFGITHENQVTVMLHCGSRGFGHQICDDYLRVMLQAAEKYKLPLPDRELAATFIKTPEADAYLGAMRCAVNYAFCNRQVMTHWARESFEQVFKKDWEKLGLEVVYDVCHNIAKVEEHNGKNVCVHRKGATRAFWKGHKDVPSVYRS